MDISLIEVVEASVVINLSENFVVSFIVEFRHNQAATWIIQQNKNITNVVAGKLLEKLSMINLILMN